jgi:hypothetical protein
MRALVHELVKSVFPLPPVIDRLQFRQECLDHRMFLQYLRLSGIVRLGH